MAFVFLVGCGGATVPAGDVASAQAAVRAANEVGAQDVPQAALHLKYAREQLDEARRLIEEDRSERAKMLLKRAEADAELALTLAREAQERKKAQKVMADVEKLQKMLREG